MDFPILILHLDNVKLPRSLRIDRVGDGKIAVRVTRVGRHRRPLVERLAEVRACQGGEGPVRLPAVAAEEEAIAGRTHGANDGLTG